MRMRNHLVLLTLILASGFAFAGNGALSGAHYNLNIIGVPKGKSADMSNNDGHRIFMPLFGTAKILLQEGAEFKVLDANGTDGAAKFQLPNSDADNDGITTYSVFARALGKPGGEAKVSTCAIDPLTGEEVCSTLSYVAVRESGKSSFTNVTKQLLYIYADLDGDGTEERYPLFDDRLQDYFWNYDNKGLKVLQLRFYEMSTNVN
ncbi:hypothetical protein [Bdellovibrio sp. HCB-110]|uniref:hypothetical protein n=1 Tax=Bdellovibrio sp. HCB-110 TaxID=3391182 RepID=UPI0039B5D5E0